MTITILGENGPIRVLLVPVVQPGVVSFALIEGPFHPGWNKWAVNLCHLRFIEGEEPPEIFREGATHQISILSMDPKCYPMLNLEEPRTMMFLQPPDLVHQFSANSDADAANRVERLLGNVVMGQLSPDSDFKSVWIKHLDGGQNATNIM